ncbi:MAG: translation initiation factor IF-3, partial [Kiritimatiellia bacterium]
MRCISDTGEQLGVIPTSEALRQAAARGMDLVEVSPTANPPVCRIMNFGKFRYEESRKTKLARKNQHATVVKEVKFHLNVEEHDYQTKLGHILDFMSKGHRVKASLLFRGRENEHRDLGYALFERLRQDCE